MTDRVGLILPQGRRCGQGGVHHRRIHRLTRPAGKCLDQRHRAILQRPVRGGGPLGRPAPAALCIGREPHRQLRGQEPVSQAGDLLARQAPARNGAQLLDHIRLREPGAVGHTNHSPGPPDRRPTPPTSAGQAATPASTHQLPDQLR